MPEFKVGDRVKCIKAHDGNDTIVGKTGTVCDVVGDLNVVAVKFDAHVNGHDLQAGYRCKYGYGWNVAPEKLELIPRPNPTYKVIIYRQGNKTTAKYMINKALAAEACATCSSKDTFSIFTGAQIALARLAQQYAAKPVLSKEALDKALENFEIIE